MAQAQSHLSASQLSVEQTAAALQGMIAERAAERLGNAPVVEPLSETPKSPAALQPRAPGVYFGLNSEEYHRDPSLGSTDLKALLVHPACYWHRSHMNPERRDDSDSPAKKIGRALHALVLEGGAGFIEEPQPSGYPGCLVTLEDLKAKCRDLGEPVSGTKAELAKRIKAKAPDVILFDDVLGLFRTVVERDGLEVLKADVMAEVRAAATNISLNPHLARAFVGGAAEVSIFWRDGDDLPCKARYDYLKRRAILNLKTFANQRKRPVDLAIHLAIADFRYDLQAAHYLQSYPYLHAAHANMVQSIALIALARVRWVESRSFISYDKDGSPQRLIGVNIDITERKRTEEHQRALIAELDHRVKNVLATVSAVAGQTLETSGSMDHFVAALDGRIRSMAIAHELLSTRQWRGLPMAELVQREFAAYARSNNTKIDGPEVVLSAEAGQAMGMVIHELVTNAAKYGALSTQSGHVSVRWYRKLNGSAQLVVIWEETGGPRVEAPKKSGYGSGVVRGLIPYEFRGTVDYRFPPEGVRCRLEIPFDQVSSDNRNAAAPERPHYAGSSSALVR